MKYLENNKFDYFVKLALLDCGQKDVKMFDEIDDSKIILRDRLNKRIKKLISRKAHEQSFAKTRRMFVRVAIAAMLIMSLMFATLISITAIRESIWKTIVEWHENYIAVRFESVNEKEDDNNSTPQEEIEDNVNNDVTNNNVNENNFSEDVETPSVEQPVVTLPTKIEVVRKPTYIIDGVVEDVFQSQTKTEIDYYLEDILVYSFSQKVFTNNNNYIDNSNAVIGQIDINGSNATLVTYTEKKEIILLWNDNEYVYALHTDSINPEELIKIALSVK